MDDGGVYQLCCDKQVGFGRSIDPVTNLITFKQNISNSYTLSTRLSLFNGFATINTQSCRFDKDRIGNHGVSPGKNQRYTVM